MTNDETNSEFPAEKPETPFISAKVSIAEWLKTERRHLSLVIRHSNFRRRSGFTLLEMLTTVAALIIILGLMVSLSNRVRNVAAVELSKDLLRRLDGLMDQYEARYHQLPTITPFIDPNNSDPREEALQFAARENNRDLMSVLRMDPGASTDAFNGLPEAIYSEVTLRDAWGTPIVYMPALNPAIGMAPQNRRFFFSAGPDRKFLTQEDNLYSYEESSSMGGKSETRTPKSESGEHRKTESRNSKSQTNPKSE